MKKIGIITYHRGTNYGAFLQAWSLQTYLKELYPNYLIEIIDYQSEKHIIAEQKVFKPRYKRDWLNPIKIRRLIKYNKFKIWQDRYLNLSEQILNDNSKFKFGYDSIIYGSDEIWNIKNWIKYVDLNFFAHDIEAKKIAFAPSFGSTLTPDLQEYPQILDLIRGFHKVSVRDKNSKNILQHYGIDSKVVLDPTFLVDWTKFTVKRPIRNKYILLNISRTDNLIKKIDDLKELAKELNTDIINLTYTNEISGIKNINSPDPFEWVSYFKYAEHIFTDTFHGTVFAINTKNQFTVLDPGEKSNKIVGILKTCGIERDFISETASLYLDNYVNYQDSINNRIVYELKNTQDFLNDI
jgi:hypothetical protein